MVEQKGVVNEWNAKSQKAADEQAALRELKHLDNNEDDDNDIMGQLTYRKLELIYNDYKLLGDPGLDLKTFVKVMLEHLTETNDKVTLVKNLIELFRQIDVNNDADLDWFEFTNYIIELGMVRKDKIFIDAIKNYYISDIKDMEKHDTEIENICYIDRLKHLLVMERDAKRFKVYNSRTGKWIQNVPSEKNANTNGAIIAADYVEKDMLKFVATTSNDESIKFWDPSSYILADRITTADIQMCVKWCGGQVNKLFTAGTDAVVHAYDVAESKEIGVKEGWNPVKKDQDFYHDAWLENSQNAIMDLLPIPEHQIIASAGLDAKICLWRMDTLQPKPPLIGHQKGVYSLDFDAQNQLIMSAGLEHDVFLWNPNVQTWIFRLKGHNHSLVGVKSMPGTNQIISADNSGTFRIWDVRTFTTVQTFNCPLNEIYTFAVTQPPKRIIAGGKRLIFYNYDEPTDHHLADEDACLCVLYNPIFYSFITAHPKCIKVWDATNGCLQSVFRDITSKDITCMCLDKRNRKLFVGDQRGRVYSIQIKNGAKMKKFRKDQKFKTDKEDISCLYHYQSEKQNLLISTSWDCQIRMFDDSIIQRDAVERRKLENKHKGAVNFIDFKDNISATASDDGQIYLHDYEPNKQVGFLESKNDEEVKICKFLQGTNCLVSADLGGNINFFSVTPSPLGLARLCSVKYFNEEEQIKSDPFTKQTLSEGKVAFACRALDFNAETQVLYTGDEMGYIQKWDLKPLLKKLQDAEEQAHTIKGQLKQGIDPTKVGNQVSAFMTSLLDGNKSEEKFSEDDVVLLNCWRAHMDMINWVSFVPELKVIATCSFDCNVYMFNENCEKVGSLVLGNKAVPDNKDGSESRPFRNKWNIKINKSQKLAEEMATAKEYLDMADSMDYKQMKAKGALKRNKELGIDRSVEQALRDNNQLDGGVEQLDEEEQNRRILENAR